MNQGNQIRGLPLKEIAEQTAQMNSNISFPQQSSQYTNLNCSKQIVGYNPMGVACLYPTQTAQLVYSNITPTMAPSIPTISNSINKNLTGTSKSASNTVYQMYPQYYSLPANTTASPTGYPIIYTSNMYNTPFRYAITAATAPNNYYQYPNYACIENISYHNSLNIPNNQQTTSTSANTNTNIHQNQKEINSLNLSDQAPQTFTQSKNLTGNCDKVMIKYEEIQRGDGCKLEQTDEALKHQIKVENQRNEINQDKIIHQIDLVNDQAIIQMLKKENLCENDNIIQNDKIQSFTLKKDKKYVKHIKGVKKDKQQQKSSIVQRQSRQKEIIKKSSSTYLADELNKCINNAYNKFNQQQNNNQNHSNSSVYQIDQELKINSVSAFQSNPQNENFTQFKNIFPKKQEKSFLSTFASLKSSPSSHHIEIDKFQNKNFRQGLDKSFRALDNHSLNQSSCEVQGDVSQTALINEHVGENNELQQLSNEENLQNKSIKNISINSSKDQQIQAEESNEDTSNIVEKNQQYLYNKAGTKFNKIQREINKIQRKVQKILIQEFVNKNYNYLKLIKLQIECQREKFFKNMTLNSFVFEFLQYTQKRLRAENNNDKLYEKIKGKMLGKVTSSQEFLNYVVNHEVLSSIFIQFIITPIEKITTQIDPKDQQEYQKLINRYTEKVFQHISKLEFISV